MPPQFLYFDLGNVLIRFCNDRMVRQMAAVAQMPEAGMRELLAIHSADGTQWQLEAGQITPDQYYAILCQAAGWNPPREELEHACSDIFGPMEESLGLVTRLATAGHRLGILSNTNAVHWSFLTDGRFPELSEAFEQHVTSFGVGAMKPDERIYKTAAEQAGAPAPEIFFVDDRIDNVQGALRFGWDAVQFTSAERLRHELQSRGVRW